ncbi:hypothetical protein AGMMS49965_10480 [Bacteroidia bacterium]|nr:hypothetical protein AGMMS49965_10480 [Bacteroidia bacterium]
MNDAVNTTVNTVVERKLSDEQQSFCESFFIAIQVQKHANNDSWNLAKIDSDKKFHAVTSLLSTVKQNGYDDVIHAFAIPREYNYEEKKAFAQSVLEDLGLDANQSVQSGDFFRGSFGMDMYEIFIFVYHDYNSRLKIPELKTTFVETLDNGNEVWLVQDYQSMRQARLIVKKNGELSIGNVTDLETYINQ